MTFKLYRGLWPKNVSKLAKYIIKFDSGEWRVAVLYDVGDGMQYLAVEDGQHDLVEKVNAVKRSINAQPGGAFYINEFRHIIVPVSNGISSHYYYGGRFDGDLRFQFEGRPLTTRPVDEHGTPLRPGDRWVGPRPGIPYVLSAGATDIYFESPALTADDPPSVRENVIRKVKLSMELGNRQQAAKAAAAIGQLRGYSGGRFYVNEHGAMFTPVDKGDGNGLSYIFCGEIDLNSWFTEPKTD